MSKHVKERVWEGSLGQTYTLTIRDNATGEIIADYANATAGFICVHLKSDTPAGTYQGMFGGLLDLITVMAKVPAMAAETIEKTPEIKESVVEIWRLHRKYHAEEKA